MITGDSLHCLKKAKVGDQAKVCLEPNGFDDEGRSSWRPSKTLTSNYFSFPIIAIHEGTGLPVIGVPLSDTVKYGFSPCTIRTEYYIPKHTYGSTYILLPRDIKTVKIYKKTL